GSYRVLWRHPTCTRFPYTTLFRSDDVWYAFVAIGSAHSIIINNTSGTTDIVTEVFDACGGASLICQDTPNSPIYLTGLTAGNTYYFRIYTYTSTRSEERRVGRQCRSH